MSEYFIRRGSQTKGPFSAHRVADFFRAKKLTANDEIAESQSGPWSRMASIYRRILAEADREGEASDDIIFAEATADDYDELPDVLVLDEPAEEEPAASLLSPSSNGRLTNCIDCGGTVSLRATTCPHCGAPTSDDDAYELQSDSEYDNTSEYEYWDESYGYDAAEYEYTPPITRASRGRTGKKRKRRDRRKEYQNTQRHTDICAVICFASGMMSLWIMPIVFAPVCYIFAWVSRYRIKEDDSLKGNGLRITGAIMGAISLLYLIYLFRGAE